MWFFNQVPMPIPKKLRMSSPKTVDLIIWPEPVEIQELANMEKIPLSNQGYECSKKHKLWTWNPTHALTKKSNLQPTLLM